MAERGSERARASRARHGAITQAEFDPIKAMALA